MAKKKPSEKQAFLAQQRKEQRKASAKAEKKKRRTRKTAITVISCAAAAAVVAGSVTWCVKAKPLTQLIPAEKTENYSLSAADISFYAWQIYNSYINSSSGSDSSNLPDTEKSLADQDYNDDTTWEAYFTEAAKKYGESILAYCEAADKEGYTPTEDVSSLVEQAKEQIDFDTMPKSVQEKNVTHALELYFKAQSFSGNIQDNMSFTEEELDEFYQSDPKKMQVCSYLEFAFSYDDSGSSSTISQSEAEELARDLRRCTSKDAFEKWVHDYYAENTTLSEDELTAQIKTLYREDAAYTEGDDLSEWAFSGEAKAGDATLLTDTDNKKITVCLLTAAPERDETHPVNLRQILFTSSTYESSDGAHSAAEKALEEWESSDKTESTFASMADQYTEDTSVSGGLYQDVTKSQLMTTWRDWCFDDARASGDVTILDSTYGSCLVYYVSAEEKPGWELTATADLEEKRYNELQDTYEKEADVHTADWMMRFVHVNELG